MTTPIDWERRYISLDDVTAAEPPWVLPGILPVGFTLIEGPGRRYKTTFAVEIAACLSLGQPLMGKIAERPGKVLFNCAEQSARTLKFKAGPAEWWEAPADGTRRLSVLVPRPEFLSGMKLDQASVRKEIISDIEEFDPACVIFDPYGKFILGDENDKRVTHEVCEPLQLLAHARGMSVVFIHHTAKLQAGEKLTREKARGSSALPYLADAVLLFTDHDQDTGKVTIEADFRDHEFVEYDWTPAVVASRADRDLAGLAVSLEEKLYEAWDPGVSMEDYARDFAVRKARLIEARESLVSAGKLVRDGRTWRKVTP